MSVRVNVRVRPMNATELADGNTVIVSVNGQQITVEPCDGASQAHHFIVDAALWSVSPSLTTPTCPFATQQDVFDAVGVPVLEHTWEGYNGCIFAYGQTGSGKTYTMMGTPDDEGIVPRVARALFEHGNKPATGEGAAASARSIQIEMSYFEIYCEKVRCLLNPSVNDPVPSSPAAPGAAAAPPAELHNLRVREHPVTGPFVEGLARIVVSNATDFIRLVQDGNALRATSSTAMNATSSRSHAVVTIYVTQKKSSGSLTTTINSKLNLVDLAGSERADKTLATGKALTEGSNINRSLHTLGAVINTLSERAEAIQRSSTQPLKHVPYRDSVLTWLLKDNLGGNSKTVMIAAISPSSGNSEETLSTLRYAQRAKKIMNTAVINESNDSAVIAALQKEINALQEKIRAGGQSGPEMDKLRGDLETTVLAMQEMRLSYEDKAARSLEIMLEREQALKHLQAQVQEKDAQIAALQDELREARRLLASSSQASQNSNASSPRESSAPVHRVFVPSRSDAAALVLEDSLLGGSPPQRPAASGAAADSFIDLDDSDDDMLSPKVHNRSLSLGPLELAAMKKPPAAETDAAEKSDTGTSCASSEPSSPSAKGGTVPPAHGADRTNFDDDDDFDDSVPAGEAPPVLLQDGGRHDHAADSTDELDVEGDDAPYVSSGDRIHSVSRTRAARALTVTARKAPALHMDPHRSGAPPSPHNAGGGRGASVPKDAAVVTWHDTLSTSDDVGGLLATSENFFRRGFDVRKPGTLGSVKKRVWLVDTFRGFFYNKLNNEETSFQYPMATLLRVDKCTEDNLSLVLHFSGAPHPYQLRCHSTDRRDGFYELAVAVRRGGAILWAPGVCGAKTPFGEEAAVRFVDVPNPMLHVVEERVKEQNLVLRLSSAPFERVSLWYGCLNMQQRPLPPNHSILVGFMPPNAFDVYVVAVAEVAGSLMGKPDLSVFFRSYLGAGYQVVSQTTLEGRDKPTKGNHAVMVFARRQLAYRMSNLCAVELDTVRRDDIPVHKGDFGAAAVSFRIDESSVACIYVHGTPIQMEPGLRSSALRSVFGIRGLGDENVDVGVRFDYCFVAGAFGFKGAFAKNPPGTDELIAQRDNVMTQFTEATPTDHSLNESADGTWIRTLYAVRDSSGRFEPEQYRRCDTLSLNNNVLEGKIFVRRPYLGLGAQRVSGHHIIHITNVEFRGERVPAFRDAKLHIVADWIMESSATPLEELEVEDSRLASLARVPPSTTITVRSGSYPTVYLRQQLLTLSVTGVVRAFKDQTSKVIGSAYLAVKTAFDAAHDAPQVTMTLPVMYRTVRVGVLALEIALSDIQS